MVRFRLSCLLLGLSLALVGGPDPQAADIVVATSSDGPPYPIGRCTLRDAVTAANNDTATGYCSAGDGADRILFDRVTAVTLRSALPAISESLEFDGRGSRVTLRRDPADVDLFRLLSANSNTTLTLRWMSIENGAVTGATPPLKDGGGVRALGTLVLEDSRVTGNSANADTGNGGGIVAGQAHLLRSEVSGNSANRGGGGIHSSGSVTLIDSRVEGNIVSDPSDGTGGGIVAGTLHATGSSVAQNSAAASGGGVRAEQITLIDSVVEANVLTDTSGRGAGVYADVVDATGSRFLDNGGGESGGAIYADEVTLVGCVVDGNATGLIGGGVYGVVQATLHGTTLSNNTATQGGGVFSLITQFRNGTISGNAADFCGGVGGAVLSIQNSTITDNDAGDNATGGICALAADGQANALSISNSIVRGNMGDIGTLFGPVFASGVNNIIGPVGGSVTLPAGTLDCDPLLEPLADNGGAMPTHAIVAGSCAQDAATNPFDLPTDQRGRPRTAGPATDIGAYELQPDALFLDGFED